MQRAQRGDWAGLAKRSQRSGTTTPAATRAARHGATLRQRNGPSLSSIRHCEPLIGQAPRLRVSHRGRRPPFMRGKVACSEPLADGREELGMRRALRIGLALLALAAAFAVGRLSVGDQKPPTAGATYDAGYRAGREAAFAGYDGGWAYGVPYVITLRRGGHGITYRIASRKQLLTQSYGPLGP